MGGAGITFVQFINITEKTQGHIGINGGLMFNID